MAVVTELQLQLLAEVVEGDNGALTLPVVN